MPDTNTMFDWWWLDFSQVEGNCRVRNQGRLLCIKTASRGYFSPDLERFPTRQDLATKEKAFPT